MFTRTNQDRLPRNPAWRIGGRLSISELRALGPINEQVLVFAQHSDDSRWKACNPLEFRAKLTQQFTDASSSLTEVNVDFLNEDDTVYGSTKNFFGEPEGEQKTVVFGGNDPMDPKTYKIKIALVGCNFDELETGGLSWWAYGLSDNMYAPYEL